MVKGPHYEMANFPKQAMDYATKETTRIDQPFEFGIRPKLNSNNSAGGNKKPDLKLMLNTNIVQLVDEGTLKSFA